MILVTVGTPQQPFDRLVKAADEYAAQTAETVVIQAGTTTYEPKHANYFRWTTFQDMERLTQEARIVVAQASAGAIILALKFGKPVIVVPRLSKFGEHFNDHQSQLALALKERGQAEVADDITPAGLKQIIDHIHDGEPIHSSREDLVNDLKRQLDEWQRNLKHTKCGRDQHR